MSSTNQKNAQTFEQKMGLTRAQDARRQMAISPRDRHREKVRQALRWIHGWGQSTQMLVLAACGSTKGTFLTKLKEHGYIRTEAVLGRTFWLLNKSGLDLLRSMSDEKDKLAMLSGTRHVNLFAFSHNMHAQVILATKISQSSGPHSWWCDRQLRSMLDPTEPGAKAPDAAFQNAHGCTTYIEVERSAKKQPELEAMLLNLARLLERNKNSTAEIYIRSGIADRYKSTLANWLAKGTFRAWSLSTDDEIFESGIYPLTPNLAAAMAGIRFITLKESS